MAEWRRDWFKLDYTWAGDDPKGPESGQYRCHGGGSWWSMADGCTAGSVMGEDPDGVNATIGFRVFRAVPPIKVQGSARGVRLSTATQPEMTQTDPAVPKRWLEPYLAEYGGEAGDYNAAAEAIGVNGFRLCESCVAGLDPTDPLSRFTAQIAVDASGAVTVRPDPELTGRIYKVWGSAALGGPWADVTDANGAQMGECRFFKVSVEMSPEFAPPAGGE